MKRKRILILTLSFGAGHVMASAAITEAIRLIDSGAEVRTIDCLQLSSWGFRAAYAWPYWMMIRFAPSLWARLFQTRHTGRHDQTAPEWLFRLGCRRVFQELREWQPDVILATEVGACEIASLARRSGVTSAPILAVTTDHESEPVWAKEEVDQYFVPTLAAGEQLIQWGVSKKKIVVSGIPVLRKFHSGASSREIRERLRFSTDRPLVLVMGGGMGPLRMDDISRQLIKVPGAFSIVAVTGKNLKLRKRVERLRGEMPAGKSLTVFGWVENVDELMRAADVLVTKPGGLTLTEAASVGVPMVCVNPIPGPEEAHCRLVEEEKLGLVARRIDEVSARVTEIIAAAGPARRWPVPDWLRRDAAEQIARSALQGAFMVSSLEDVSFQAQRARPGAGQLNAEHA